MTMEAAPQRPLLEGRYELGAVMARTRIAATYRAFDTLLDREVAVKVLLPDAAQRRADAGRAFDREAALAARVQHPNVVRVYAAGSAAGRHYVVMELVDGRPLREVLEREGRLPVRRAASIAADVLAGLEAAHAAGLTQVLDTNKVVLTADGVAKIGDLGVARHAVALASVPPTAAAGGSCTPPEQAAGRATDARGDVFSAGCLLATMLAGRAPFGDGAPAALLPQQVAPGPPPVALPAAVSNDLAAVVRRALAKDPADRFASARDMRRALLAAAPPERRALAPNPRFVPVMVPQEKGAPTRTPLRTAAPVLAGVVGGDPVNAGAAAASARPPSDLVPAATADPEATLALGPAGACAGRPRRFRRRRLPAVVAVVVVALARRRARPGTRPARRRGLRRRGRRRPARHTWACPHDLARLGPGSGIKAAGAVSTGAGGLAPGGATGAGGSGSARRVAFELRIGWGLRLRRSDRLGRSGSGAGGAAGGGSSPTPTPTPTPSTPTPTSTPDPSPTSTPPTPTTPTPTPPTPSTSASSAPTLVSAVTSGGWARASTARATAAATGRAVAAASARGGGERAVPQGTLSSTDSMTGPGRTRRAPGRGRASARGPVRTRPRA